MPEFVCKDCVNKLREESDRLQEILRDLKVQVANEQLDWFAPGAKQSVCSGTATRATKRYDLPLTEHPGYQQALADYTRANALSLCPKTYEERERPRFGLLPLRGNQDPLTSVCWP